MKKIRKIFLSGLIILVVIIGFLIVKLMQTARYMEKQTGLSPATVGKLIFDGGAPIEMTDGKTNILLLGMGGGGHAGPDLTDTMMIVSIDMKTSRIALTSLPRDIWSDTLKDKINAAYHYGEEKKKGGGMTLARAVSEDVTGLPIHYTMIIDFSQFTSLIDRVNGVDVLINQGFTDTEYPISGKENDGCGGDPQYRCRYETIIFQKGLIHMDGNMALKYVRSRHSEGQEGTDFSRGNRQQDVLVALKDKVMSLKPWFNLSFSMEMIKAFDKATETDLNIGELLTLGKVLVNTNVNNIIRISLESVLQEAPTYKYGKYVLEPDTNFSDIHSFIKLKLQ